MAFTQAKCRSLQIVTGTETAFFSPPKNKVSGLKKKVWVKDSEVKADWSGENAVKEWTGMEMLKTKEAEVRKKVGAPSRPAYSAEMLKQQALEQLEESAPTHVALFDYDAREEDDLEVREGDKITLKLDNSDGWFTGYSHRTKEIGIFPADYVKALPPPPPKLRSDSTDGEPTSVKSEKAAADARAKAQKNSIAERAKAEKAAIAKRAKAEKAAIVARAKEEKAAAEATAKKENAKAREEKALAKEEKKTARAARTSKSSESEDEGTPKRSSPSPQVGASASARPPPPSRATPSQTRKGLPPTRPTPTQTRKGMPPTRVVAAETDKSPRSGSMGAQNEMAAALAKVLNGGPRSPLGGPRSPLGGLRSPPSGLRSPPLSAGPAKPPPPSAADSAPPPRANSAPPPRSGSLGSGRRPPPSRAAPPMRTAPAVADDDAKPAPVQAPPKKADPPAPAKAVPAPVEKIAPSVSPAVLKTTAPPPKLSDPLVRSTAGARLPSPSSTSPVNEVQKVQLRKTNSNAGPKPPPSAASPPSECGYAMLARRASLSNISPTEIAEAAKSVAAMKAKPATEPAGPERTLVDNPAVPESGSVIQSVASRMNKFSMPNESVSSFTSAGGQPKNPRSLSTSSDTDRADSVNDTGASVASRYLRSLSTSSDTDSVNDTGASVASQSTAFGVSLRKSASDGNFVVPSSSGSNNSRKILTKSASVEPATNAINEVKQFKLKKTNSTGLVGSSSPATKVAIQSSKSTSSSSSSSSVRKSASAGNLMSKLPKEITIKIHYRDTRRMRVSPDVLVAQLEKKIKAKFSIMDSVNLWYKKKDGKMACINSLRLDTELRKNGIKLWCLDKNVKP